MTEPKTQQKLALDEIVKMFNSQLASYGYGEIVDLSVETGNVSNSIVIYRNWLAHQAFLR
jgi:hypothetical protein